MFALYDYDPVSMSPNPNPDAELVFKAGDIITVYGNMVSPLGGVAISVSCFSFAPTEAWRWVLQWGAEWEIWTDSFKLFAGNETKVPALNVT